MKQKCAHVTNIYCDAANPEVVQALKMEFEERFDEQYIREQFAYCRKYNLHIEDRMFIVSVPFSGKALRVCNMRSGYWMNEKKMARV